MGIQGRHNTAGSECTPGKVNCRDGEEGVSTSTQQKLTQGDCIVGGWVGGEKARPTSRTWGGGSGRENLAPPFQSCRGSNCHGPVQSLGVEGGGKEGDLRAWGPQGVPERLEQAGGGMCRSGGGSTTTSIHIQDRQMAARGPSQSTSRSQHSHLS